MVIPSNLIPYFTESALESASMRKYVSYTFWALRLGAITTGFPRSSTATDTIGLKLPNSLEALNIPKALV